MLFVWQDLLMKDKYKELKGQYMRKIGIVLFVFSMIVLYGMMNRRRKYRYIYFNNRDAEE